LTCRYFKWLAAIYVAARFDAPEHTQGDHWLAATYLYSGKLWLAAKLNIGATWLAAPYVAATFDWRCNL
jgi:hypothetical protein